MTRTCYGPGIVGIVLDPSDLVSEVDLGVRLLDWCCQLFDSEAAVGCCQRFVVEAALVLTEILSYQNLFVVLPIVRSINYFWVLPTLSIRVKGKRFTFECWTSPDFLLGGHRLQRYSH